MDIAGLTIDAGRLWAAEAPYLGALAFVDLAVAREWPDETELPPCPVIGVGDRDHPLAGRLDAVVEPPASAESIARQVLANPRAAAVTVQLLRLLPSLGPAEGLVAESLAYGLLQGSGEHARWLAARGQAAAPSPGGRADVCRSGDALVVTLSRPECGNAIDSAMRDGLHEAFTLAAHDHTITTVFLRARGRTFSLGADLSEFGTTRDPATAHEIRALTLPARAVVACANKLDAHVRGGCVGAGLELVAWARRVTAAPDAWFHLPELAMGLLAGAGGCVSLTRRIGRQRTALMILSGKRVSARQALAWGLVDAIVDKPPGDDGGADVV